MSVMEMRMVRWMSGVTREDRIKDEYVKGSIGIASIVDKMSENRLRWLGYVMRREETSAVRVVMKMNVEMKRGRGRPKKRWLENIENDVKAFGLCIEDVKDRDKWRFKTSSPSQIDKNTKVFISPNRYAVLNTDEDSILITPSTSTSEDLDRPPQKDHNAKPVPPPIHIKNIFNFSAFNTVLKNITGPNGFTCKSTPSYLIVQPTDKRTYNAIISHLHETSASFHSFTPPSHRTYRVVIKNLHNSTLHTDFTSALTELGHSVKSIYNAKNRNNCPLPVFFVDIRQQDNNNNIHDITSLLNTIVKIEKPIKKRCGPPQCHNCQDYGHTKNYCNHEAQCVICGENHLTIECSKDQNSPTKCALCANDHTTNFKGCPVYKAAFKKTDHPAKGSDSNTYQKTISYAEATKNHQNVHAELKITDILSSFISNLNSLITPLISLLPSVLKALTSNSIP
ncbi:hypothetical protein QTP88_009302 [Uroleucon formosanum]